MSFLNLWIHFCLVNKLIHITFLDLDESVKWKSLSCVWLCDPMDYTVLGILQARILEWVAFPFSMEPGCPALQVDSSPAEPQGKLRFGCHTAFVSPCLTYFIWLADLQVHPCCCRWHEFIPFCGQVIFHCLYLHYPLLWACFRALAGVASAAVNSGVHFLQIRAQA